MKSRSSASVLLAVGGIIQMGLGLYFVFLRQPLLPEDPRYMGSSLQTIQTMVPGLLIWLRRVFWVMGGYMFTTGLLTSYVALSTFRARAAGAALVVALAGLTSIGLMAVVNFVIDSDFKWIILAFTLPWPLALALYWLKKRFRIG